VFTCYFPIRSFRLVPIFIGSTPLSEHFTGFRI
jgi:hypothetical protein